MDFAIFGIFMGVDWIRFKLKKNLIVFFFFFLASLGSYDFYFVSKSWFLCASFLVYEIFFRLSMYLDPLYSLPLFFWKDSFS